MRQRIRRVTAIQIQKRLKTLGFYKYRIDGVWGRLSTKALKAFQSSVGILKDGIWGRTTSKALFGGQKRTGGASKPTILTPLTVEQIRKAFKRNDLDIRFCKELSRQLNLYAQAFKINTEKRRVLFLSQAVHEVGVRRNGKPRLRESLNYSVRGLRAFSYFRKRPNLARKYGRTRTQKANQKAIANLVYDDRHRASRYRLGNTQKGDGWKFRGMFLFQTTGRFNASKDISHILSMTGVKIIDGDTDQPKKGIVNTYKIFILGGMAHWHRTKMYEEDVYKIVDIINAGLSTKKKKQRYATAERLNRLLA